MAGSDYYERLGVQRNADADEIKRAFRKLAMTYHPDKNPGDSAAEERFKSINEAYAVLSDPGKRKQYDRFGADGFNQRFSQEDIFRGFDGRQVYQEFNMPFGDILSGLFGGMGGGMGGGRHSGRGPQRGAGGGFGGVEDLFGGMGGMGGRAGGGRQRRAAPQVQEMEIGVCEAARGTERLVSMTLPDGQKKQISVKVPAGMEDGKRIRVRGDGEGFGALEFRVRVKDEAGFSREGKNLTLEKSIRLSEALLGTSLDVTAPNGETKTLRLPPGTQPGRRLRMRGFGLGVGDKPKGDLIVRIAVTLPKKLNDDQRALAEQLRDQGW